MSTLTPDNIYQYIILTYLMMLELLLRKYGVLAIYVLMPVAAQS